MPRKCRIRTHRRTAGTIYTQANTWAVKTALRTCWSHAIFHDLGRYRVHAFQGSPPLHCQVWPQEVLRCCTFSHYKHPANVDSPPHTRLPHTFCLSWRPIPDDDPLTRVCPTGLVSVRVSGMQHITRPHHVPPQQLQRRTPWLVELQVETIVADYSPLLEAAEDVVRVPFPEAFAK